MDQRPLVIVTVPGGRHDGERFATPVDRLREETVIPSLDGPLTLRRHPASG